MPERAHVTSVDALESFRANLIIYLSKARPTLEEVSADVQRTRGWLEGEQRTYWENEFRRRSRALQEAQAGAVQRQALQLSRGQRRSNKWPSSGPNGRCDEAEAKLRVLKQWNRVFDNRVDPLVKQMEKLQTVLAHDMVQAVAYLAQAIQTLDAYAEVGCRPRASPGQPRRRAQGAEPEQQAMKASGNRLAGITKELRAQWSRYEGLLERRQVPGIRATLHGRTLGQRGSDRYSDRTTGQAANQNQDGL